MVTFSSSGRTLPSLMLEAYTNMDKDPLIEAVLEVYANQRDTTAPIKDFTQIDFYDLIPKVVKNGEFNESDIISYTGNKDLTNLVKNTLIGLGYEEITIGSILNKMTIENIIRFTKSMDDSTNQVFNVNDSQEKTKSQL